MKPLTMLEFVLSQCDIGMEIQSLQHQIRDRASRFHKIENYAKFLSQKPEKWMFVPCDDDGNVLEEKSKKSYIDYYSGDYQKYKQALDRVIFEGFKMPYNNCFESKKIYLSLFDFDNVEQLINEHGDFLTLKKPIQ